MAIYSIAQRGTTGTAAAPQWEVIAAAANKPKIMELGVSQNAATAGVYGFGRPAAIGITPTTPLTVLDESDGNGAAGVTKCAVAWATPPTAPTNFFRRVSTPATVGAGVIWTFPRGLGLPAAGTVVVWNIGTNAVADFWAVVDE